MASTGIKVLPELFKSHPCDAKLVNNRMLRPSKLSLDFRTRLVQNRSSRLVSN
ncbi:hypothetical protein NA23_10795 [Fervidobacterium islandicum]|uniref:Uncharacterized protein n=1 Tax=Fervidobacterium islandicum TaxID=2423 RepID=A0AAJ5HSM6_FERIS|nr:hypothetical protein [Fervidobacterium islandicum]UOE96769.1 hypothetical protein NA23_10795 [Fervidobacterium islandicum]